MASPEHLSPLAKTALRTSLAIAALGGASLPSAETIAATHPAEAAIAAQLPKSALSNGNGEQFKPQAETLFPAVAQEYVNNNTVYMYGIGCSGSLIRLNGDPNAAPVGVSFAKHCYFLSDPETKTEGVAPSLTSFNGQEYDTFGPIVAETGSAQNDMTPVGEISQVITGNGRGTDFALGVLPGATPGEVLYSYRKERAENSVINNLKRGETIYMKGWPVNQKEAIPSDMTAQQFSMTYIGKTETYVTNGERINVLVAAIPKGQYKYDDSMCSYGASGSSGFILENGKPRTIGNLSVFWNLANLYGETNPPDNNPIANLDGLKTMFPGVDWNKYAAACGFSFQEPKSTTNIQVVPNSSSITGEGNPIQEAVYQAGLQFSNPDFVRTVVNGTAVVSFMGKGGADGAITMSIENPLIAVGNNGDLMLGYYQSPGAISAVDVTQGAQLSFYPNTANGTVSTELSSGTLIYPSVNNNGSYAAYGSPQQLGSVEDSSGLSFGLQLQSPKLQFSNTPWTVSVTNGQFSFNPEVNS